MSTATSDLQPNRPMSAPASPQPEGQGGLPVARKTSKSVGLECRICTRTALPTQISRPCRRCKEPWCHDCIRNLFMTATRDLERMPARCDHKVMHHNVARGILTADELANYKLKYEEFCTPKPFYCPVPTCSTFLPPRKLKEADVNSNQLSCTACTTRICTKCRQGGGDEHICGPNTILAKIQALKYKLCPKCGTGVLKMYGCDHIRCHCGAHWCWACERSIDVCWGDPCPAQLDDGAAPEADTDDEEDDREAALSTTTEPPLGFTPWEYPILTGDERAPANDHLTHQPPVPPPLPQMPPSMPATDPPIPVDADSEAAVQPASEASTTTIEPENLDDPLAHDWEREDLNFGGEPIDESWDVWGCAHRTRRFEENDVLEGWLQAQDLECQTCFDQIHAHDGSSPPPDQNGITLKRTRSGGTLSHTNHSLEEIQQLAGKHQQDAAVDTSENDKGMAQKMAWECKKCGVLFCEQCRNELRARRKQASIRMQT